MESRFAFTAQHWGHGAVVCRAVEDRPGPVVEQQFGEFPTWTQALSCANKLNDGLDLDFLEVRHIVTSSLLATAAVLQESLHCRRQSNDVRLETRSAQLRFLMAEVSLALKFCHSASLLSNAPAHRVLMEARDTLQRASLFLGFHAGDDRELRELAVRTQALDSALQALQPSFQSSAPSSSTAPFSTAPSSAAPSFMAKEECWPRDIYRSEEMKRQAIRRRRDSLALLSKPHLASSQPELVSFP